MSIRGVLVAVHDTAGVVIDDEGDVWLTPSLDEPGGILLDDLAPREIALRTGETLVGGRLPAGAATATVLHERGERIGADTGRGAWAAVLDQVLSHTRPPVCFRDTTGALVRAPLPSHWPRQAVTDAADRCPACDQLAWEIATPGEASSEQQHAVSAVLVCGACGHQEPFPTFYAHAPAHAEQAPAAVAERLRQHEAHQRLLNEMTLRAVEFPIYAAAGMAGRLCGSGGSGDRVISVCVGDRSGATETASRLTVETAIDETAPATFAALVSLAREELTAMPIAGALEESPAASDAAVALRFAALARARRRLAARAPESELEVPVDGTGVRFARVQVDAAWVAVGRTSGLILTITATGVDPGTVSLVRVQRPIPTLI